MKKRTIFSGISDFGTTKDSCPADERMAPSVFNDLAAPSPISGLLQVPRFMTSARPQLSAFVSSCETATRDKIGFLLSFTRRKRLVADAHAWNVDRQPRQ